MLSTAIDDACRFLGRAQCKDGRWLDFRGGRNISSSWVTAYIGTQLARIRTNDAIVDTAGSWLRDHEHRGGGWGYNRATPPDADSIANVLQFALQRRDAATGALDIDHLVRLLEPFFIPSVGGFRTYCPIDGDRLHHAGSSWCAVHPCVTAMCASALAVADPHGQRQRVHACAAYLRSQQLDTGLIRAFWWDGDTYATYHAARFLHMVGDNDSVARARNGLADTVHGDGGWGSGANSESSAFHTALAVSTLTISRPELQTHVIRDGLSWLLRTQEPDGGWPSVPILRVPGPEVHMPENADGEHLVPPLADRNRLFTTATVLSALVDGRRAFARAS